ncbi:MAG: hypothetical protein ACOCVF_00070 [bacterium]
MADLKEQILSKYETYVRLGQPHNTTPIFLKENTLDAMEDYAKELLNGFWKWYVKLSIEELQ